MNNFHVLNCFGRILVQLYCTIIAPYFCLLFHHLSGKDVPHLHSFHKTFSYPNLLFSIIFSLFYNDVGINFLNIAFKGLRCQYVNNHSLLLIIYLCFSLITFFSDLRRPIWFNDIRFKGLHFLIKIVMLRVIWESCIFLWKFATHIFIMIFLPGFIYR